MKTQTLKNKSTLNTIRICALPIAAFFAVTASAATGAWTGTNVGTWDTTDANWSGVSGTPWDITNGPTNTASFATAGDSASLTDNVYPSAITFLDSATVTAGGGKIFYAADNTTKTITVDPTFTGTINAPINYGGTGATGNVLIVNGGGTLDLAGDVKLAANDTGSKSSYFQVNGASTLNITGRLNTMILNSATRLSSGSPYLGGVSGGNTVNVTGSGKLVTGNFNIGITGNAGTDNNTLNVSAPGTNNTATDPATNTASFVLHGNSAQLNLNSSGNAVSFSNGAFVMQSSGGGTSAWTIGNGSAGNASSNNSLTITGLGTTVTGRSNGSFNQVGSLAGSGNSLQVLNGGLLVGGRVGVGMGNGTDASNNNFQLISGSSGGTPSYFRHSGTSNTWLQIGIANNSSGNSFRVENGARADVFGTGATRKFAIGLVAGADNNYIKVSGANSAFNLITQEELYVGGDAGLAGGAGNHVDVFDGGSLIMDNTDNSLALPASVSWTTWAANPTTGAGIVLIGSASALNIGDGNAISLVKTGSSNGHTNIELVHATSVVNFNNGRLRTGVTGNLITGAAGSIEFDGPAYFDISSGFTSTINLPITGVGSMTKEGVGTLSISGTAPAYTGNTTITDGILSVAATSDWLADSSTVTITAGALNLNFTSNAEQDDIAALFLPSLGSVSGVWGPVGSGAANETAFITGTGTLNVVGVPEPGAAVSLLGGLGMLLGLRRRRA